MALALAERAQRWVYGLAVDAGLAPYRPIARRAGFEACEAYAGEKFQRGPEPVGMEADLVAALLRVAAAYPDHGFRVHQAHGVFRVKTFRLRGGPTGTNRPGR